jgi:hypothetical protein
MAKQNGFAIAYGVCINGSAGTIKDDEAIPATFYNAQLVQSMDMREEPTDSQDYKDCHGTVRSKVISGSRRVVTVTLIPTNGTAGASGGIASAEDMVKLPAIGDVITLAGFQGPTTTTGEINGDWTYQGNGRVILANDDAARLEVELEQNYNAAGTAIDLSPTT